jgi:hypothetical protein
MWIKITRQVGRSANVQTPAGRPRVACRRLGRAMLALSLLGLAVSWPAWAPDAWRWLRGQWFARTAASHANIRHAGLSVEALAELTHLATLRVEVADVVTAEVDGYTGGSRAVVVVGGDVLLGVDLSAARIGRVDALARTAELHLPPPTLLQARVDHQRTRLMGVTCTGLWLLTPASTADDAPLLNQAYQHAQATVAKAGEDPVHRRRAAAKAESVLQTFGRSIGWELTVRYQ